jgi:hypothetical protein
MTLKRVKDLFQVTTADQLKTNKIDPEFAIKYERNKITISYLTSNKLSVNKTAIENFIKNKKISNLKYTKSQKNIIIEEISKLNPNTIEKQSEQGSVWIFNRALVGDQQYSSVQDIIEDPKFKELEDIFDGNIDYSWLQSFYNQQKRLLEEFGKSYWGKFEYGENDDIMEFIKDVLSEVTLNGQKIKYKNWNPSDIWMVKKNSRDKIKDFIRKNISRSSRSQTLHELNALLKILIRKKELIGLSLKKVGKGDAKFIYVNINITTKDVTDKIEDLNEVKKIIFDLSLNRSNEFKDQQAKVVLTEKQSIQIKSQSPNRQTYLTFETQIGSGGRGGKSEVKEVIKLLGTQSTFTNKFTDYPNDASEFLKHKDEYVKMFNKIKSDVNTSISTEQDFVSNFLSVFNSRNQKQINIATYKLMQLKFLYNASKVKNVTELYTDIYYLGIKYGKKFAPHGKLY